jgi:rhodanese-related sulfurtransferase
MNSAFPIGLYQLENLLIARPTFHFLDVRLQPRAVSAPRIQNILAQAAVVTSTQVLTYLRNLESRVDDPIVLLCEDGRLSHTIAMQLEEAGFRQVYIVEGGLDGLLREASMSS